jgi:methionine biosynthesis protein MetW
MFGQKYEHLLRKTTRHETILLKRLWTVSLEIAEIRSSFHQFDVGFNIIIDLIEPGTRVLDLGCGSGTLLQRLRDEKHVKGCGVELDQEKVIRCIERGIQVLKLDLDEGLEGFPNLSYEYVVLSRTLQQLMYPDRVVKEMLRVGFKSIIAFPNYGYWKVGLESIISGRTPCTDTYPHPWFNTPDIHRLTIKDFKEFIRKIGGKIEKEIYIVGDVPRQDLFWSNRRAEWEFCLISSA